MRLLFCGSGWFPVVEVIRRGLPAGCSISVWDRSQPLALAADGFDVLLPSNGRIDRAVLEAVGGLRLIQQPAAGTDGIDLEAARELGIPVCNAPGSNYQAVAEIALYMALALARRYRDAADSFRRAELGVPIGIELSGRTLGIIGRGRAGGHLAQIAEAMEMTVLSVTSKSPRSHLEGLLRRSDVISVHCPLTERTRGLIGAGEFALMKPGAIIINCARGPILDRGALETALASGKLGGVGLDTYWEEPWDPTDPLYEHRSVLALPHIGGSSEESFSRIAAIVCENVKRLANGEHLIHRIA